MLISEAIPTPTFANHESFHLRYGWLKKAYDAVQDDPRIFVSDDATIKLGVGKNMVRAIRFWSLACKVLHSPSMQKKPDLYPTPMGHAIFDDKKGLDPYLEDPQTLWLLQWLLFAPPCRIPVWWIIMNEFSATNIKMEDLVESVQRRIINISEWKTPSPKSVKKDIDVFVHTYTNEQGKLAMEDYLDCPFRQMRMIGQYSRDTMRFAHGIKYEMTPHVVAFACLDFVRRVQLSSRMQPDGTNLPYILLDFVQRMQLSSRSISVTRLATEAGGVGSTFKIAENDLAGLLSEACDTTDEIQIKNVNGAPHLVFDDAVKAAESMLGHAYKRKTFKLPRLPNTEAVA